MKTKTDLELKKDIEEELRWDPRINEAKVGVTVDQGAVTLLGTVGTYAEKWAAEEATKRVGGVSAVAEELTVKLLGDHQRSDTEIAVAVQNAISWDVLVPKTVRAEVKDGWITVKGEVDRNHQREAAVGVLRHLVGVKGILDQMTVRPSTSAGDVRQLVSTALARQAVADANAINVEMAGSVVTLSGRASSWRSMEDATAAAWSAPGVSAVVDRMTVGPTP